MNKIIIAPNKYVQGKKALENLENYTKGLGDNVCVIADEFVLNLVKDKIASTFKGQISFEKFNGECSKVEIKRLEEIFKEKKINVVVGVGGGKTLDTAKATAYYLNIPVVIAPTIASTDAPCSALSVIYKEDGVFDEYLVLPKNPDLVIVDTEVVASSPVRLTVSGMGDALSTYFEARATFKSGKPVMAGGLTTNAAMMLAKGCFDILLRDGLKAKEDLEKGIETKEVDNIIEANTLLSGLGFESGGLAAAHAIHNGLTALKECHHLYHGEKVAFGTIVQLVLEDAPKEELEQVRTFCKKAGLPTNLYEMGVTEIVEEDIMKVAQLSTVETETIHNLPFEVNAKMVYDAILKANSL
ncbi:MAG: glycerol dehydrogenase [Bacilli bacterium]|nr:glycerol dehydrogenase [Bacilli bacterium]